MAENPKEIYFTATGQEHGKPLIFRSLKAVPTGVDVADLANRVSIIWHYESASNGMPDATVNTAQIEFEDALTPMDVNEIGRLMLVVTGNNRKEWHWYAKDFDNWLAQLNLRLSSFPVFPIEIDHVYEPEWSLYKDFVSQVSGF